MAVFDYICDTFFRHNHLLNVEKPFIRHHLYHSHNLVPQTIKAYFFGVINLPQRLAYRSSTMPYIFHATPHLPHLY